MCLCVQRNVCGYNLLCLPWRHTLIAVELTDWAKLAVQATLRTPTSVLPMLGSHWMLPRHRAFLQGSWGTELRSLCFLGNTLPPELLPQPSALLLSPHDNRYIYGKPVQGVAYTRFALMDEQGKRTFLRGLETQAKVG